MATYKHIIISRTDAIGDVVLTLPLCGFLKSVFDNCTITFIGRTYTRDIITLSSNVDGFVNYDDLLKMPENEQVDYIKSLNADALVHVFPQKQLASIAFKAGIKTRIGTSHRFYNWRYCNKLVNFSRKNSALHESQLNFKLLKPLGITHIPALSEMPSFYGYPQKPIENQAITPFLAEEKSTVVLHPRSKGSAREWGLENFSELIHLLPAEKYNILICGTKADGETMRDFLVRHEQKAQNLTGKLTLAEYIALISNSDALVAASTGPLHIAAALGIKAIGLYAPMRPIHPGRWQPIGPKAKALVIEKTCSDCRKSHDCACIRSITAMQVLENIVK